MIMARLSILGELSHKSARESKVAIVGCNFRHGDTHAGKGCHEDSIY